MRAPDKRTSEVIKEREGIKERADDDDNDGSHGRQTGRGKGEKEQKMIKKNGGNKK